MADGQKTGPKDSGWGSGPRRPSSAHRVPVLHSPLLDRGTPGDVNPVPDVHLGLGEAAVVTIIMRDFVVYRSIFEPPKVTIDP